MECKTIAEIRALEKGTACQYVGTATTTYYYGDFGVMMQDETGAILLSNSNLGAKKAADFITKMIDDENVPNKYVIHIQAIAKAHTSVLDII